MLIRPNLNRYRAGYSVLCTFGIFPAVSCCTVSAFWHTKCVYVVRIENISHKLQTEDSENTLFEPGGIKWKRIKQKMCLFWQ